jgi:hypothetical protein
MVRTHWRYALCGISLAYLSSVALGQAATDGTISSSRLVNVDTTWVPAQNHAELRADVRAFGGNEKTAYVDAELSLGLSAGFGLTVRGSFARFLNFNQPGFTVRHGGSDFEALLKYAVPQSGGLMIAGGISAPNTPAQNTPFGVAEAAYKFPINGADLYLGAKGAFRSNSTQVGAYAGLDARLSPGFDFIADFTAPFTGNNTYSTSSGNGQRRVVYGAGFRFEPLQQGNGTKFNIDLGITNGIGGTTGFSLTPALGNSIGVYGGVGVRF